MCSCSKSATVQIDDLYKLETKEDVINYLGKPDPKIQQSESYDIYKVLFMDEVFSLIVFYEDEIIDSLTVSVKYNIDLRKKAADEIIASVEYRTVYGSSGKYTRESETV